MSPKITRNGDKIIDVEPNKFDLGVVVPTYNHGKFLKATLLSLLGQSYADIKIVVVDDFSTDNTQEILREFQNNPRISVIRNTSNLGESEAVNVGWYALQTQFVAIVSADDPQNLNWAEDMFASIRNFPNFVGYYPNLQIINDEGDLIKNVALRDWDTKTAIERLVCIASAGTIFNRSFLPPHFVPRSKDVKYPSDLIQFLNITQFGDLKKVANVYGVWRESPEGMTATLGSIRKAEELHKAIKLWLSQGSISKLPINFDRLNANLYGQMWKLFRKELSIQDSFTNLLRYVKKGYFFSAKNQYYLARAIFEYKLSKSHSNIKYQYRDI
jgi:glycosyltransferase involved in cell wall biosynthesis